MSSGYGGSGSVKIELNRDWSEFLSALIARRVRFLLIGSHAVAGHAEPRLTEDLDVLVEPSIENARRLREALVDFGFGDVAPAAEELAVADKVFMLGRKPWRIDILTTIAGEARRGTRQGSARREAAGAARPVAQEPGVSLPVH